MILPASSWPCSGLAPMIGPGLAEGITALAEAQALRGCGVGPMVEVTEAMTTIMAIMMAMDLGQIDLEETSITVFQECLITDMVMVAPLSRAPLGTACT